MAKGKQHPRLDKISKLPAFPLKSIGHVLQLIKAPGAQSPTEIVGNFNPGSHLAILRQRPLYCYIPLIRKGSKLNFKMIGP